MWRAFFLAVGVYFILVGAQCLSVDRIYFRDRDPPPARGPFDLGAKEGAQRELKPAPWLPWTFISSGSVVCLYSFTLPRKLAK